MSDRDTKRVKLPALVMPARSRPTTPSLPVPPRTVTPSTQRPPIGTRSPSSNAAILAIGKWLAARGLVAPIGQPWSIEVALGVATGSAAYCFGDPIGTRFHLRVRFDEWGYSFCHAGRVSTIRVTDVACVQSSDDHFLLAATPALVQIETLIRQLESRYDVCFQRRHAAVRTTLAGAEPVMLRWVSTI